MFEFKKAVRILKATVGLSTNHRSHLPDLPFPLEVKSLHTDFKEVEEVSWDEDEFDGTISIEEKPGLPELVRTGHKVHFQGPLIDLDSQASDLRFSFWGNQGFLYRFVLRLLEKNTASTTSMPAPSLMRKQTGSMWSWEAQEVEKPSIC